MKIAIGCDPNAQAAKEEVIAYIAKKGYGEVTDFGSEDPIYANVAIAVGEAVAAKKYDRGILICGTGIGVSIAANKVPGAYAALVSDVYSSRRSTGPSPSCASTTPTVRSSLTCPPPASCPPPR